MPFDGSGNFSRLYSWQSDRDNGIRILASRMDGEFDNFAAGMNQVFFRNGLVPMSGNLNMGQNYIYGLGAGSATALSLRFGDDPNSGLFLNGYNKPTLAANGVGRLEANTAGVQVYGTFNASGAATFQNSLTVTGASSLNGDTSIGTGANPAAGTLRYLDVWNQENTNNGSGSILRLITKNAAGTGTTTVDMVKYKGGGFSIVNNEPNTAQANISFGVAGQSPMTISSTLVGVNALSVNNGLTVLGTSSVGGAATFSNTLTAAGVVTANSGANINGNLNVTGTTALAGLTAGASTLNSATITNGLTAANLTANSSLVVGDSNYYFTRLSSNPIINFDPSDYLQYDRTINTLSANIAGGNRWQIDATTMRNYVNSALRGIVRFGTAETQNIDADATTLFMRGTNLAFQDAGATTNFVWANSAGLGVGSTNPGAVGGTRNLHLFSTGTSIMKSEGTVAGRLDLGSSTLNSYAVFQVNDNGGTPYRQIANGAGVQTAYDDANNHFFRNGGGTDKVVIESNGNVRIGSSLGGAAAALDLQRAGTATSDIRVRNASVNLGLFVDSGSAYTGSVSGHPYNLLQGNVTRMAFDTAGNIQIGNGQATGAGALRYVDTYNLENTNNNSGVIQRLITQNVAGTAATTVDIVKYKNGAFSIINNEPNTTFAVTNFGVAGSTPMSLQYDQINLVGAINATGAATFTNSLTVNGVAQFNNTVGISGTLGTTGIVNVGTTLNTGGSAFIGNNVGTGDAALELGNGRSGAGNAYIDFHSQAGTDYDFRVIRAAGANGNTDITNAGTGWVNIESQGNGSIRFAVNGGERFRIFGDGGITSANVSNAVGFKGTPINTQGGAYTVAQGDQGRCIYFGSGAGALTIPTNASVPMPNGTVLTVINDSGNARSISPAGGVVLKWAGSGAAGARTLANGGMASIVKVSTDTWFVSGAGLS